MPLCLLSVHYYVEGSVKFKLVEEMQIYEIQLWVTTCLGGYEPPINCELGKRGRRALFTSAVMPTSATFNRSLPEAGQESKEMPLNPKHLRIHFQYFGLANK